MTQKKNPSPRKKNPSPSRNILPVDELLKQKDRIEYIDVPSWGDAVIPVRILSAESAIEFANNANKKGSERSETLFTMVMSCAVNEDGTKMFDTEDRQKALRQMPMAGFLELQKDIMKLNGMTEVPDEETGSGKD